ncbi:unnamed protein product [Vitrella brassicaformis CCMP3155]|uniref:Uncharacterized protein n=1 Tax=Vitrella brassicaformis (strain CCMP3155) TaxID=1169540 RepID=A0A0G4FB40_VITBC|nr:unnamed protein product [Vitrella brassicaformis CCMP3155]|eukprot:CEM10148.1 unnamed protein product [Vitrella brassicaformis CCMP3155]
MYLCTEASSPGPVENKSVLAVVGSLPEPTTTSIPPHQSPPHQSPSQPLAPPSAPKHTKPNKMERQLEATEAQQWEESLRRLTLDKEALESQHRNQLNEKELEKADGWRRPDEGYTNDEDDWASYDWNAWEAKERLKAAEKKIDEEQKASKRLREDLSSALLLVKAHEQEREEEREDSEQDSLHYTAFLSELAAHKARERNDREEAARNLQAVTIRLEQEKESEVDSLEDLLKRAEEELSAARERYDRDLEAAGAEARTMRRRLQDARADLEEERSVEATLHKRHVFM